MSKGIMKYTGWAQDIWNMNNFMNLNNTDDRYDSVYFCTLLGGGGEGVKKSMFCTLVNNIDNFGWPLIQLMFV